MRVAQLRVLGGAMARVPNDATAFAHRDRKMMINVASFYEGPDDRPRREPWVSDFAKSLSKDDLSGYVGFLADEGQDQVRAAYPGGTWDRLRRSRPNTTPTICSGSTRTSHRQREIPLSAFCVDRPRSGLFVTASR